MQFNYRIRHNAGYFFSIITALLAKERPQMGTILFCHVPKTAGTSLRMIIEQEYKSWEYLTIYNDELNITSPDPDVVEGIRKRIKPYKIIFGHFSYGVHNLLGLEPNYITFVRHPLDRVDSLFQQLSKPESPFYEQIQDGFTLPEMVASRVTEMTNNHMARVIAGVPPITGELVRDKNVLEQAKANIEKAFFFTGAVETIQSDFSKLARCLSWRARSIPYSNVSQRRNIEMDEQTKQIILEYNQLDVELFDWVQAHKVELTACQEAKV